MNTTVKGKLIFLSSILMLGIFAVSAILWISTSKLSYLLNDALTQDAVSVKACYEMQVAKKYQGEAIALYIAHRKMNRVDEWRKQNAEFDKWTSHYLTLSITPDEKNAITDIQTTQTAYVQHGEALISLVKAGQMDKAAVYYDANIAPAEEHIFSSLTHLEELNTGFMDAKLGDSRKAGKEAEALGTVVPVLAALLGLWLSISIIRRIVFSIAAVSERLVQLQTGCISSLTNAVQAMEHGDLTVPAVSTTQPLEITSKDEFGVMAGTFNGMLSNVQSMIGSFAKSQQAIIALVRNLQHSAAHLASTSTTLASTAEQVGAGIEEISATTQEVAHASEQSAIGASEVAQGSSAQARALADSTAKIQDLASSAQMIAKEAGAAADAADEANQAATSGVKAVNETVAGMAAIQRKVAHSAETIQSLDEASQQIGGILGIIEGIAEQTNLLALNAAIEAARAGDSGRGFAVVAEEVRKLAERSASATKEIAVLVQTVRQHTAGAVSAMDDGTREVAKGAMLAEEAGSSLAQIQLVIDKVASRVQEINATTGRMSATSANVAKSIADVAAIVEQSSAVAEEMSSCAEEVSASVQTVAGTTVEQAAAVEEMAACAETLAEVSRDLARQVSLFHIEAETQPVLRLSKAA
ncbi:MAG: methyl-accepting chemotaxis protein [Capsulimonas sp.]|uniref:methyl-accepting chemotaxis protein n=1 Tax=Capsulimonas sp. TaxID=2494211 RepID=UPI003266B057